MVVANHRRRLLQKLTKAGQVSRLQPRKVNFGIPCEGRHHSVDIALVERIDELPDNVFYRCWHVPSVSVRTDG
jgi:hypothetical protein